MCVCVCVCVCVRVCVCVCVAFSRIDLSIGRGGICSLHFITSLGFVRQRRRKTNEMKSVFLCDGGARAACSGRRAGLRFRLRLPRRARFRQRECPSSRPPRRGIPSTSGRTTRGRPAAPAAFALPELRRSPFSDSVRGFEDGRLKCVF